MVSLGLNLLTQVLIVRYLSKEDYGVFAYVLALVTTISSLNRLGMDRTVARFIPIYDEKDDPASVAGAVLLALGTTTALGFAIVALVIGFSHLLTGTFIENPAVVHILVVLIALAPVDAFNSLFESLFSAFAKPRIIFMRKYIAGPCLKLGAIYLTIATSSDLETLAYAYLIAGVIGLFLYGVLLPKVLREHDIAQCFRRGMFRIKYRQLFRYTMPVFTAEMADALRLVLVVVILEYFHNLSTVADYRAVLPIARLNTVVLLSFSMLFLPMAARLFAQKNNELLQEMQSHVALWVTVLSYPVFAVCISLAEPLIVLLLGERYSASAPVLAILAVGFFFKAALGLNRLTLRALGKVRVLLYIEVIATVALIIAALLLVPRFGAIGGAIAGAAVMIAYSCMNTLMLWRITGKNPLPWLYTKVYLIAAACALGLWLVRPMMGVDSILLLFLLTGFTWMIVIFSCWKSLHFDEIFPEVLRLIQSMKRFFGGSP
jgi:O-antigen/teichoic acid export membrane protein